MKLVFAMRHFFDYIILLEVLYTNRAYVFLRTLSFLQISLIRIFFKAIIWYFIQLQLAQPPILVYQLPVRVPSPKYLLQLLPNPIIA